MLMDTRQLAAFCAVVERKSFSQAAERLGVTQPAVSLQIRSLEQRLGRQLLDRSGRRVEPTEAGRRLYASAQRVLAAEEHLLEELDADDEGAITGTLELGASTGPGGTVVPLLLCEFQEQHPDMRVRLTVSDTQTVVDRVAERELELGIVGAGRRHRGVAFEPFFRDEVVLVCPSGHRFAGKMISLDDLKGEKLIVMQEGAGVRPAGVSAQRGARRTRRRLHLASGDRGRSCCRPDCRRPRTRARSGARDLPRPRERAQRDAGGARLRRVCTGSSARVIVRWGLAELPGVLGELGIKQPLLVASERMAGTNLGVRTAARWTEVPSDQVAAAAEHAGDGVIAVGGGSAIDFGKAISAAADVPVVSVPTTYAGAEWTSFYGIRDPERRMRGGGAGAHLGGVVYEPALTLSLPRAETVGTALNALAHSAEALYVEGHNADADEHALTGARLIGEWLPRVVDSPQDLAARTKLLEGAMHSGMALGGSMLALGHAIAQALGGRYGLPHGAMNALALPAALRFNAEAAPEAVRRFGEALGTDDPAARVEELARLGGFERLRDFGVLEEELAEVAAATVERAGAKANPRPPTAAGVEELLRSIY